MNRFGYRLDFPGNALDPGCDYNRWGPAPDRRQRAVVYAHVVGERVSGKLALQYWFFYPFNDFNNTHEGRLGDDQLVFDAQMPERRSATQPVEVRYSSHEGAEHATWDDDKLELVDERPVVYPAAAPTPTSTATRYGWAVEAGVGCDDTRGPHRELSRVW